MKLLKTDKARAELQPGQRSLGQRERCLLLLADGHKTLHELGAYMGEDGPRLVLQLLQAGYLVQDGPTPVAAVAADPFDGKRSLATTRMFLFDLRERMFARRAPALAAALRDALRNARDRASMLEVCREMLDEITHTAGAERADAIRERIALLLPDAVAA